MPYIRGMAKTPESKVKRKVAEILIEYDAYYFSPPANGFGRAGIPDIIACYCGQFIAIECKAGKNITTALQRKELSRIEKAGGYSLVINESNIDQLVAVLDQIGTQREWVGLTKEERHEISLANKPYVANVMAAHEEELKRRNT
jgi:hypothetical protein